MNLATGALRVRAVPQPAHHAPHTTPAAALAEALARVDDKLEQFRAGRDDRRRDYMDGTYPAYVERARQAVFWIGEAGFDVVGRR